MLPLWSYHKLPKCSFRITRQVISILTDCTTGTAAATTALNRVATVSRPVAAPDPAMVQTIVDMGFSRARVEDTLRRVRPQPLIHPALLKSSKVHCMPVPFVRLCGADNLNGARNSGTGLYGKSWCAQRKSLQFVCELVRKLSVLSPLSAMS